LLNSCARSILAAAIFPLFSLVSTPAQTASPAPAQQDQTSPPAQNPPAEQKPAPPQNSGTQGQSQPGQTQPGQTGTDKKDQKTTNQQSGTSNDRIFWTLPNFLSVDNSKQVPPLTAAEKFKVVARGTFDPVEFAFVGVVTFIDQAENTEPSYGQGAEGYGKRYATNYADTFVENFMVGAVFPSVLRQDPRYYQLGKGSFLHRTEYAISRIFITRSDSGHKQFNFSEIFGSALAAGISTYSYHPRADQNLPNAGSVWGTQVAQDAVSAMLKEFWPDIHRKFHKKSPAQDPSNAASPVQTKQ